MQHRLRFVVGLLFLPFILGIVAFASVDVIGSDSASELTGRNILPVSSEGAFTPDTIKSTSIFSHTVYLPVVLNEREPMLFGVELNYSPTRTTEMVDLGVVWARYKTEWSVLEPTDTTPDNYNWSAYDAKFLDASSNGINIVATLRGNPSWAAAHENGPLYSSAMPDYLEFISALVERYDGDGFDDAPGSPVVQYWEFYNEPDGVPAGQPIENYWGTKGAEYAAFLAQVYPVVKAANPRAMVLNGGIAYDLFSDTGGPFQRDFVDKFLAAGGTDYIDLFNFHYYPEFSAQWEMYGPGLIGKTTALRNKLAEYGVINKPIAITEVGLGSDVPNGDELQSRYVVKAFCRALAANVKIVNWFQIKDWPPYFYNGLLDGNYNPKPSYTVYKTMTTQLADVKFIRALNTTELNSTQAEGYTYQKRSGELTYVVWTNDDSVAQIKLSAKTVTKISKLGTSTALTDSSDGVVDGYVTITYTGSPVYLILAR